MTRVLRRQESGSMMLGVGESGMEWLESSIYLIERSGVREAAVPHLVDHSRCLNIVFAKWSTSDRQRSSSPHAFLVLLSELPLASSKELSGPSAFPAQGRGSDLCAGGVP